MSFHSIKQTLSQLQQQPSWEQYQQYRCLLQCWDAVIGEKIAANTRPVSISRQVLWVATSSSSWAQELVLRRYAILKRLNQQLPFQLKDIRCSPNQWHQLKNPDRSVSATAQHPSKVRSDFNLASNNQVSPDNNPQAVIQSWVKIRQARSRFLPLCPQCQSPTPEGELQRWNLCCHCVAQKWSAESTMRSRRVDRIQSPDR